jgi:GntR family transcriptional regulator
MSQQTTKPPFRFQLDLHSGMPVYRQIIDQVRGGMASGSLSAGDQLPTVRQLAVDLAINPNTVVRAYRELELGGLLETHQGTGTFIGALKFEQAGAERTRQLSQIVGDCVSRAGAAGFTVEDLMNELRGLAGGLPQGEER